MSKRIMIPARLWCAAVVGLWAAAGVTDDTVESGALQLNLQRALELALAQNRNLAMCCKQFACARIWRYSNKAFAAHSAVMQYLFQFVGNNRGLRQSVAYKTAYS